MKNLIYLFILCIIILASCDPDEPCPTCFEDIVRCKVNGKDWVSNCKSNDPLFGCKSVTCHYYFNDGNEFDLNSTNDKDNTGIVIRKISSLGGLKIGENILTSKYELEFWDQKYQGNCMVLKLDSNSVSKLTISNIDTTNFLIEGNFYGTAINECKNIVKITNGYFKTKFKS